MEIYDCTRRIKADMTVFPGDMPARLIWVHMPSEKRSISQTAIKMGMHTGTHIDAPLHFIPEGKNLGALPLDCFIGPCRLMEIPEDRRRIELEDIAGENIQAGEIVLLKTTNSGMDEDAPFTGAYVALTPEAAKYLVDRGVKTVGVDYLSVDPAGSAEIHNILLGAGLCVIEGLYFKDVPPGTYFLSALPLRAEMAEASPVRAVLVGGM